MRKAALAAAIAWTAGIFIACLWPGKELPHSGIPAIDKWTHLVLFGGFTLLWLGAYPSVRATRLAGMVLIAAALGWFVECLQGWLPRLGRNKDVMDGIADAVGGVVGALLHLAISLAGSRLRAAKR